MTNKEASRILRKVVDLALAGDPVFLRLCVERLSPPPVGRVHNREGVSAQPGANLPGLLRAES